MYAWLSPGRHQIETDTSSGGGVRWSGGWAGILGTDLNVKTTYVI